MLPFVFTYKPASHCFDLILFMPFTCAALVLELLVFCQDVTGQVNPRHKVPANDPKPPPQKVSFHTPDGAKMEFYASPIT